MDPAFLVNEINNQKSTVCCLNRYFVSADIDEYFLFSELDFIAVQPLIEAWWQGKSFRRVRQNPAIWPY